MHIKQEIPLTGQYELVDFFGPAEKVFKGWEFFEEDFYEDIFINICNNKTHIAGSDNNLQ